MVVVAQNKIYEIPFYEQPNILPIINYLETGLIFEILRSFIFLHPLFILPTFSVFQLINITYSRKERTKKEGKNGSVNTVIS